MIVIEDDDNRMSISDGDKTRKRARESSNDVNDRKRTRVTSDGVNERKRARDNSVEGGQHKRRKCRKSRVYELRVQPEYLEQIRSGIKTIEGRPARERYMRWRSGDVIRFLPTGRRRRRVTPCEMRIVSTQRFKGFREMLKVVGVRACLPNLRDDDITR